MNESPRITIVAAVARNGVIGRDGGLPWHLPDDLRHFKRLTMGHPVIMGRKTFEEVGRPLPGRLNVVITRQPDWTAAGVVVAHGLDEAIEMAAPDGDERAGPGREVFIIGGAEIYQIALRDADRLVLTHVEADVPGDTCFPEWDRDRWRVVESQSHAADDRHPHAFTIRTYER